MSKKMQLVVIPDFMKTLVLAREEARRFELKSVSEVILLKTLLDDKNGILREFFELANADMDTISEATAQMVRSYVSDIKEKGLHEEEDVKISFPDGESTDEIVFTKMVSNYLFISGDYSIYGYTDEKGILFSMVLGYSNSKYLMEFFDKIHIDVLVLERYIYGMIAEETSEELVSSRFRSNVLENIRQIYDEESYDEETCNDEEDEDNYIIEVLGDSLTKMEAEISDKPKILGRDNETRKLIKVLLKVKKKNAILVGEPGVGKSAIVEHLVWLVANGKVEALKDKVFYSLDVNAMIAGTKYRGDAEEKFVLLADFLERHQNVILFIDEIHTVVGAGACYDSGLDLANSLKPLLAREDISIIGCTTNDEYERYFSYDGAFKRRFEKIEVTEPKHSEVYSMVKNQIDYLSEKHNVKIGKKMVDYVIMMASCFYSNTCNPDRTLDLIDRTMADAKMEGKDRVDKNNVLNNFDANFEAFKKMSLGSKMSIAYHEAGHYLVQKYGKLSKGYSCLAISVIPAEDYAGITVSEFSETYEYSKDYDSCLAEIAIKLAGRVAEKMYSGKSSSGASADIREATNLARSILLDYGLSATFGQNRHIDKDDMSEKLKNNLNQEVERIISKAYNIAGEILKEHRKVLEVISKELCKKGIVTGNELNKLCKQNEGEVIIVKN